MINVATINPHVAPSASLMALAENNRQHIVQMVKREVIARYKGLAMGAALFHSVISLSVLLLAFFIFNGYLRWFKYIPFIMANPLTFIIEQAREVLIWGHLPNWTGLGIYTVVATSVAWAGYALFQKTRKAFSDVL